MSNVSSNPRPYNGYRPKAFETRSSSGAVWSLLSDDATKTGKWYDDWDTFIAANGYGTYTEFFEKTMDEASAPDCCTLDTTRVNNAGSRTYQTIGQTVGGDKGCNPFARSPSSGCAASTSQAKRQWWVVTEMMGFDRIHCATPPCDDVCNSPRTSFNTRVSTYGDKIWVYTSNSANSDFVVYGQDDAHCISSAFIDTWVGSRENAAMPLSMWQWQSSGYHYWAVNRSTDTSAWDTAAWGNPKISGFENGDGVLWYAGYASSANAYDVGGTTDHNIPIESLRLKLWRYGMYVMEYAKLLQSAGQVSIANTQINAMYLPTQYSGTTWGTVAAWETAREAMASEVLRTLPASSPSPPSPPPPAPKPPPSAPKGLRIY